KTTEPSDAMRSARNADISARFTRGLPPGLWSSRSVDMVAPSSAVALCRGRGCVAGDAVGDVPRDGAVRSPDVGDPAEDRVLDEGDQHAGVRVPAVLDDDPVARVQWVARPAGHQHAAFAAA